MIAHNQRFHDITVTLDGSTFVGCTFERCTLKYSGLLPVQIKGGQFNACEWQFTGPAAETVGFLAALYSGGGEMTVLVEKTFDNIRKNATGQQRSGPIVLN